MLAEAALTAKRLDDVIGVASPTTNGLCAIVRQLNWTAGHRQTR